MELKDLITLYRHWFWLLILGLGLGLVSGYIASRTQTPIYEASTKVLISKTRQQGSADIFAINDQQLVLTYQQLLKTRHVINEVGSRLEIKINTESIKVDVIPDTQIIQIKVQDQDAHQAASTANELVQVLIEQNETLQAGRYTVYEGSLNSQITQVQTQIAILQGQITQINQANIKEQLDLVNHQITDLQDEILILEQEIAGFSVYLSTTDRANLAEKQAQLDQLRSLLSLYQEIQINLVVIGKPTQGTVTNDPRVTNLQATLTLYQQLYLNLLNNLETVKLARAQSIPTVTQIETAAIPEDPIRPIPLLYTTLSAAVGLFLAAGTVLLIDYFDDTLKTSERVREVLGVSVIGEIAESDRIKKVKGFSSEGQENSTLFNAFGILRINMSRLIAQNSIKSILVTSPGLGEGKTTVAANLAKAFGQSGKKTLLLDADLYHPTLHTQLKLGNQKGLTEILNENIDWQIIASECSGITVITSGTRTSSSGALLESDKMTQLLEKLQKKVDVIILDGPPLFMMDAQILASKVGGILLVVRQGNTHTSAARAMINQIHLMNANLLGVVLNRVKRSDTYYPDGYYHNVYEKRLKEKEKKPEPNQD